MPASETVSEAPRYVTLHDYLRVIREHRVLIALVVVVFAGAAVAKAVREQPLYRADASLSVTDISQDSNLLGTAIVAAQAPDKLAAISAETVTRRPVALRVKRVLKTQQSVSQLQSSVSANVEARTNLVVITADGSTPGAAARLANEFARQARIVGNNDTRTRLAAGATSLENSFKTLKGTSNDQVTRALYADRLARLKSLSRFASPIEIANSAQRPSTPVSPRPVRDGILGGLLGLTLGILAAFVRDSLDRRLRGSREIQEQLKLPLLGAVREEAMGRAGPVANGRGPMAEADLEGFRIVRTNLEFLDVDRRVRTLAVTSALPEEGKSTVAASLAFASAAAGAQTLLVECDLRRPSLAGRLGLESRPGLTEYLVGTATPQEILQALPADTATEVISANGANGASAEGDEEPGQTTSEIAIGRSLVCITAGGPAPRPAELLGSQRLEDFLAQVSAAYDTVILDTAPLLSVVDTLELIPHVDGLLICVRAARTTRDQARAAKAAIDHLPRRPTGLVVTGVRSGDEADYGYYYSHAYRGE